MRARDDLCPRNCKYSVLLSTNCAKFDTITMHFSCKLPGCSTDNRATTPGVFYFPSVSLPLTIISGNPWSGDTVSNRTLYLGACTYLQVFLILHKILYYHLLLLSSIPTKWFKNIFLNLCFVQINQYGIHQLIVLREFLYLRDKMYVLLLICFPVLFELLSSCTF